jgi:tetratricopeptide (TPR) repeat protein
LSKRPKPHSRHAPFAQHAGKPEQQATRLRRGVLLGVLAAAIVVAAVVAAGFYGFHSGYFASQPHDGANPAAARYVGRAVCASCHEQQDKAWQGSHHHLAMQAAGPSTVLGDFRNTKFNYFGVESRFFMRDGKFMVRTDDHDGKLTDFEVKYTFGVTPLQQYLIEFPGGRLQPLGIAWDTRASNEGGQRWFHLYPKENINHKDPLHWTGIYQNWNLQCAACHSTNLRKGYDALANAYRTTYSEINVACEACHGAGSGHVEWAAKHKGSYGPDDARGFVAPMRSGWKDAWKFPTPDAKYAQREGSADPAVMHSCASCHSRRSTIAEGGRPGAVLDDAHRLAMLTQPLYHADGQQRDEVYTWGSFLQSKMYAKGVTCMDCHEPHALKMRAEGNALCGRCHNAAVFDTQKHHFHQENSKGSQCVGCHMPAKNYMQVHSRLDHSIRIPRPDLSISTGSPNACTQCHAERKPEWAAAAMDKWYGTSWRERWHYGTTLQAGATQGAKALPSLLALADDARTPSIVRATAALLAQSHVRPEHLPEVRKLLANADPNMRIAALGMLELMDPAARAQAAGPLLADAVRGVRFEAARILSDVGDDSLSTEQRAPREKVTAEYLDSLKHDADWPATNVNIGNLHMRQHRIAEAIAAYERALFLDQRFAQAYVNLADAYRQQGRDTDGEKVLRRGIALLPQAADLRHALGLLLVRKGEKHEALKELSAAATLAPDNARYLYVFAVGLHSAGKRTEALAVLRKGDMRHPYNLEILSALVSLNREARANKAALVYAKKIAEALPHDAEVARLVVDLEGKQ